MPRESLSAAPDPVRLSLVLAGLLLLFPGGPTAAHLLFLIAVAALLAVAMRYSPRRSTFAVLVLGAIAVRIVIADRVGSDALRVTEAAVRLMLEGFNPYGIGYAESEPAGSPFPYGPIALLWYVPAGAASEVLELGAAVAISIFLALRGRLLGLAVYATSSVLINSSVDGSNDTTLGLLILAAFVAAERWPMVGAAILGLAVGFKLSALAFVPLLVVWGGWRVGGIIVATSIIAWAPVIAVWGIPSFLRSIGLAEETHRATTWSLGKIVRDVTGTRIEILNQLRYVFGAVLALASVAVRPRTLDTVILAGAAVYVVTLYAGNWASFAYFAGIAPVVCWRLDAWLGYRPRPPIGLPPAVARRIGGYDPAR